MAGKGECIHMPSTGEVETGETLALISQLAQPD